jgi:hypothetical protein
VIHLTVKLSLTGLESVKIDMSEDGLSFKGLVVLTADGMKDYGFDLEFYDKIVPSTSTKDSNLNGCHLVLCKKTLAETGWPRLIKEEDDDPFIRVGDEKVSLRMACRVAQSFGMAANNFLQVGRWEQARPGTRGCERPAPE